MSCEEDEVDEAFKMAKILNKKAISTQMLMNAGGQSKSTSEIRLYKKGFSNLNSTDQSLSKLQPSLGKKQKQMGSK